MITINLTPQLYTTLNLAAFRVVSSRATISQFRVTIKDAVTSNVIAVQKYGVMPFIDKGTYFDVAPILSSYLKSDMVNTNDILSPQPDIYKSYKLSITEIYINGEDEPTDGDTLDSDTFYIMDMTLSRFDFSKFDYKKYVNGFGTINTNWLSNRPLKSNILYSSKEYISFYASAPVMVRLRFYRSGNVIVGDHNIPVNGGVDSNAWMINVSPHDLSIFFGDSLATYGHEFSAEFTTQFGTNYDINDVSYFTVEITNVAGSVVLSQTKTYILSKIDCKFEMAELIFYNNLGGFDSMNFLSPKASVSSNKTTIKANPFQYDPVTGYTDNSGGVFNPIDVVTASVNTWSYSMVSEVLTDSTSQYAASLIESNQIYVVMHDGSLMPVTLTSTSYDITKRRYTTNNSRMSISFKVDDTNFIL